MNSFALNSFTTRRNFLSRAAFSGLGMTAAAVHQKQVFSLPATGNDA